MEHRKFNGRDAVRQSPPVHGGAAARLRARRRRLLGLMLAGPPGGLDLLLRTMRFGVWHREAGRR